MGAFALAAPLIEVFEVAMFPQFALASGSLEGALARKTAEPKKPKPLETRMNKW
jgi:hypothetical protein